ncbi:MAG TPA: hypothetical protein VM141_10495 [Planctomycetota bacterium]|nr:hypothetical protein [Planctomycetota bacterium]
MARKLIGEILREHGKVTEAQIRDALTRQLGCEKAIGRILFDMGLVSEKDISQALVEQRKPRSQTKGGAEGSEQAR